MSEEEAQRIAIEITSHNGPCWNKETESLSVLRVRAHVAAALLRADREATERAVGVMRKYLSYESQRAVSWHEVQDAIDVIRQSSGG